MADDFLPRPDRAFSGWLRNFLEATARDERVARYGLRSEELERLLTSFSALESAMAQQYQFQRQAAAARVSKDGLRRQCEKSIRGLARQLQAIGITDADRADLGLRLPKPRLTSATANQPPATSPWLRVENLPRRHLLHVVDEKTPSRKVKPPRVAYCEIWRNFYDHGLSAAANGQAAAGGAGRRGRKATTEAEAAEGSWRYLAHCSATPQAVLYTPEQTGTLVGYRCRWVSRRGKPGPWSNTVTALVSE